MERKLFGEKIRANCPKIFHFVERGEGVLWQSPDIFLILKSVANQMSSKQKSSDYTEIIKCQRQC